MRRLTAVWMLAAVAVDAQNFTYANFASGSGLSLVGNAAITGATLRLTPALISQKGAAWYSTPVSVATGFDTTFTFQTGAASGGGADGFAFVIQNDPRAGAALANHAGALGYGAFLTAPAGTAIANSLAVEVDTFQGTFNGVSDLSGNEISIHTGGTGDNSQGESLSIGRASPATNMSNGSVHSLRIQYVPGTINVYLDGVTTPTLTAPYTFDTGGMHVVPNTPVGGLDLLPGGTAYVGITASTGGSWENHDVLTWVWTSFSTDPCFAGTVGAGAGGPYDVLSVNGSAGGAGRLVNVDLNTTFSLDVAQPPGNATPANFVVFGMTAYPSAASTFTVPGFGTTCVPPAGFSPLPGLFILADSFNFGIGALLLPPPAPFSLPVFGGLPFPLTATFQGVIEQAAGSLAITNAVVLVVS